MANRPRTLRTERPLVAWIVLAMWAAVTLPTLVVIVTEVRPAGLATLIGAFGVATVGLMVRALRTNVRIDDAGIRIAGALGTRELAWSEIERFSFGRLRLSPAVAIAHLWDGRRVGISGIYGTPATSRPGWARALEQVDELNAALNAYRLREGLEVPVGIRPAFGVGHRTPSCKPARQARCLLPTSVSTPGKYLVGRDEGQLRQDPGAPRADVRRPS